MPSQMTFTMAEELFCSGTVKYYDQPVGFIVADDPKIAEIAASKVKVYYSYPQEKPLITIQEVLNANATDRITDAYTIVAKKKGEFDMFSYMTVFFDVPQFNFFILIIIYYYYIII